VERRALRGAAIAVSLLVLGLAPSTPLGSAALAGSPIDGISDNDLPYWNGSFASSPFASQLLTDWVLSGQLTLARFVVQWNALSAGGGFGGEAERARFEAWYRDVTGYGLVPEVALTNYAGGGCDACSPPRDPAELEQAVASMIARFPALRGGVIEPWNEPNARGGSQLSPQLAAAFYDATDRICHEGGNSCTAIAGDFLDSTRSNAELEEYMRLYAEGLGPAGASDWGIHPYYGIKHETLEREMAFKESLPDRAASIWITEAGAYYCERGAILGEASQARGAAYLVKQIVPYLDPAHVFYYGFMAQDDAEVPCAGQPDTELYRADGEPRAAAAAVLGTPELSPSDAQLLSVFSSLGGALDTLSGGVPPGWR
jgi:hypothetical protein